MMSNAVISVDRLGKVYTLHHENTGRYVALRDVLASRFSSVFSKRKISPSTEKFSALEDVSFEVMKGDRLGIIGRNGAGKSTLLKILSRIVTPTKGTVTLEGRVASLLEVGTGFHPELTGRENIFLNGSILGMSRAEIVKKFDEIVAFSEVEKFLDTPVKRYSSGMYVRLAFAVAAHLEPEILIIDEVLAVGDSQFQKKCLGKMEDVSRNDGRTVLFVSHNMGAIAALCNKGIVLSSGKLSFDGEINSAVNYYLQTATYQQESLSARTDRKGDGRMQFTAADFLDENGKTVSEIFPGQHVTLLISFTIKDTINLSRLIISIAFLDEAGSITASFVSDEMGVDFSYLAGRKQIRLAIPEFLLRPGNYSLRLFASEGDTSSEHLCDYIEHAAEITVMPVDFWKTGKTIRNGRFALLKGQFEK